MVHHREELIAERTQRKNKLTAICAEVFPELTQVYQDPHAPSALAVRTAFPTPAAIATASLSALGATRSGKRPGDQKLAELHRLAVQSIGTKDVTRLRGLTFEQQQLIVELGVIEQHVEELEAEIGQVLARGREGRILPSIPGGGPIPAASLVAMLGNMANCDRPAQLKAYCGWAPRLSQSGTTLDRAKLTPRGVRPMKRTMYLVVWHTIWYPDKELGRLDERLLPRKCVYDQRTQQ
jgi:Transposase IS116/IS110/IS902 family